VDDEEEPLISERIFTNFDSDEKKNPYNEDMMDYVETDAVSSKQIFEDKKNNNSGKSKLD